MAYLNNSSRVYSLLFFFKAESPLLISSIRSLCSYITFSKPYIPDRPTPNKVFLSKHDGMPRDCAINFDHIQTVSKGKIRSPGACDVGKVDLNWSLENSCLWKVFHIQAYNSVYLSIITPIVILYFRHISFPLVVKLVSGRSGILHRG